MTRHKATAGGWVDRATGAVIPYASVATTDGFVTGWGTPTWEDHFTGTALNSAVWNVRNGYQDGQDFSTMLPTNVVVANDSTVKLRAKREDASGSRGVRHYTSGYIDTIGKKSFPKGRFEARVILPTQPHTSRGMWPAFWLRDASGGGECDIMEAIGSDSDRLSSYPATPGRYSASLYEQTGLRDATHAYWSQIFTPTTFPGMDMADGQYHTFAVEWTNTQWRFITDGTVLHTTTPTEYANFARGFPSQVNLRIDLFIGSSWSTGIDYTTATNAQNVLPNDYILDYVRYWQLP